MKSERNQEIKADGGKPRCELLPPDAVIGIAKVLTFGAEKYEPGGWRKVGRERYLGAAMRHLLALMNGEIIDPESGLKHADHLGCNAMFLSELIKDGE